MLILPCRKTCRRIGAGNSFMVKCSGPQTTPWYFPLSWGMAHSSPPWLESLWVCQFCLSLSVPNTKLRSSSLCSIGVPFSLEPRLSRHSNDDLLDFLRQVCLQIWVSVFAKLTVVYSIGGYVSSRVYASLGGTERRKNAFVTATVLPT